MQSPLPFPKPPSSEKLSIKHLQGGSECDEGRETEAKTRARTGSNVMSWSVVTWCRTHEHVCFSRWIWGHGLHIPGNTEEYCVLCNFSLEDTKQHVFYGMLAHSSPLCNPADRRLSARPRQRCSGLIAIMRRQKIDGVTKEKQQEGGRCRSLFAWVKHLDRARRWREERQEVGCEKRGRLGTKPGQMLLHSYTCATQHTSSALSSAITLIFLYLCHSLFSVFLSSCMF